MPYHSCSCRGPPHVAFQTVLAVGGNIKNNVKLFISNGNFATSKNLVVKSTMFPHQNIHKYTWTSPDGKTHNQIDHVLIDRRWHSSVLDVRSFRGADCDTDHYLVIAKVRERLAVGKQAAQRVDRQRFNLRKLNDLEVRKQYRLILQIGLQPWRT